MALIERRSQSGCYQDVLLQRFGSATASATRRGERLSSHLFSFQTHVN